MRAASGLGQLSQSTGKRENGLVALLFAGRITSFLGDVEGDAWRHGSC